MPSSITGTQAQANHPALAPAPLSVHVVPMLTTATRFILRRANERGRTDHGWLKSRHTFSFADYYDPAHVGFRSLRVINYDRVAPGMGFGTHPHRDMEIFSYILEGTLEHRDSLGHGRQLKPGQIQLMSAGRGISHSEFNPSPNQPLHFLQIWIQPRQRGLPPGYTEWHPRPEYANATKVLVLSPDGRNGSAIIHQDAEIYRIQLKPGQTVTHTLRPGRGAWLHVADGSVAVDGVTLTTGDAASTEEPGSFTLTAIQATHALLFDLR
jgi:quercetin 2,3-dioxygenase